MAAARAMSTFTVVLGLLAVLLLGIGMAMGTVVVISASSLSSPCARTGVPQLDIEDIAMPGSSTPARANKLPTIHRMFGAASASKAGAGSGVRRARVALGEDGDGDGGRDGGDDGGAAGASATPARAPGALQGPGNAVGGGANAGADSATRQPHAVGVDDGGAGGAAPVVVEDAVVPSIHEDVQGWLKARKAAWRTARQQRKTEKMQVRLVRAVWLAFVVRGVALAV